jgi:small GTP-binding protein
VNTFFTPRILETSVMSRGMDPALHLRLSSDASGIRNFCMVAHVDHGKTTLSDFLVASNGLLSQHLAGKVRLLDTRPDEQERLITMKASSIALHHRTNGMDHLLHLVDSPGHIDFSCEVSAAVRLCDGALVIIDLIDGMTIQTAAMLRHMYREGLKMCLVLNKVDLLVTREQLTAKEAYERMRCVIECCNATLASYANQLKISTGNVLSEFEDPSDDVWFCPTKGNVLFASCFDGWGFTVDRFAKLYEAKLNVPNLAAALWGEHYFDPKTKTVVATPRKEGQSPLAVQLILEPIWQLYSTFLTEPLDVGSAVNMSTKLGVAESVWNAPRRDARGKLAALLAHWLPLASCVMDTVCTCLPSPVEGHRRRIRSLIPEFLTMPEDMKQALLTCDSSEGAPTVAYICKLIDTEFLAGQMLGQEKSANIEDMFLGFTRVFSGKLRKGQELSVHSGGLVGTGTVSKVFLLSGLGLEEVSFVNAGCLCAVAGLTGLVTKHATICSVADVATFCPLALESSSIVRLSVRPKDPSNLQHLVRGLHLLNKIDPQVEVLILSTGEHVIGTAGEVHAERCIKDLVDTFARVELVTSEPIVTFRETIARGTAKPKSASASNAEGSVTVSVSARLLPEEVLEVMKVDTNRSSSTVDISNLIMKACSEGPDKKKWVDVTKSGILCTGPTKLNFVGCVLFSSVETAEGCSAMQHFRESIAAGFQLACISGTMAEEPMFGIAFTITDIAVTQTTEEVDSRVLRGQVIVAVKDACRRSVEIHGRRLVEPIYECVVYSAGTTQGKIYSVLNRRRAEVVEEVPNEGSDLFHIVCNLPAVDSFGLQDELRVATSGAATAQLRMSHWATVDADPYFKPTTKEELEENGALAPTQNLGSIMLEKIRRRKGLHREVIIESAEKQKFSSRAS